MELINRAIVLFALVSVCGAAHSRQASATSKGSITILVKETAGLRRFGYPATARVSLPKGGVTEVANIRLTNDKDAPVAAQFTPVRRHPDNSIDQLDVDFNTSPLPHATQMFFLDFGPDLTPAPARGLSVSDTEDAYTVGGYRIPKSGANIIEGIRYGNTVFVPDDRGMEIVIHTKDDRYLTAKNAKITSRRIEKSGPLNVTIVFEGEYEAFTDPKPIAFRTRLEFVSSKSWVRVTHRVEDPLKKVDEISLGVPFAFSGPLTYDFGTGSWLYGTLNAGERVNLTQTIVSGTADIPTTANWRVTTRRGDVTTPHALSPTDRPRSFSEGWAHLSDASKVIAVGVEGFAEKFGDHVFEFYGDGSAFIRYKPTPDLRPRSPNFFGKVRVPVHELSAYFHFVGVPVQKTAVTSPQSMLAPLELTVRAGRKS